MWIWLSVVTILLILIRASREGHCSLQHTFALCALPWCFEYDRTNYVRYPTSYLRNMKTTHPSLSATCPDVDQYLEVGGFLNADQ